MEKTFNVIRQTIWADGEAVCQIIQKKLTLKRALKLAYKLNIEELERYRNDGQIYHYELGVSIGEVIFYYLE